MDDWPAEAFNQTDMIILSMIADGFITREVAAATHYSERSVKNRICRAMRVLGARNRSNLVAIFVRHQIGMMTHMCATGHVPPTDPDDVPKRWTQ